MVARLLWEREAGVRATLSQNPGKLWDAKADGVLPLAGNWSKTGVDPIFDHSWKIPYPGVAQLVARLLWEDRRPIHSPESEGPETFGTVACGGNPPVEKFRQNRV